MKKSMTKIVKATLGLTMAIGAGVGAAISSPKANSVHAADITTTYVFTSKAWAATVGGNASNWTSGSDGSQLSSGRGIQITTGVSGANATSPTSFTDVSQIVVTYSTNASAGAGNIAMKVGTNTEISKNVTKSGGTTDRTLTWDYSPYQSGSIKITVTCTTNSIFVKSVAIVCYTDEPVATYTVSYNSNGGSGTIADESSPYNSGAQVTVKENAFSRSGYDFLGFNTANDGSGTRYVPGDKFNISSNTTLYAQWEESVTGNIDTDTFVVSDFAAKDTTYTAYSITDNSTATYVGYSGKASSPNNGCIQFTNYDSANSKNRGISTSISGGLIKRVRVEWGNANGKTIAVYVGNTPYSDSLTGASGTSKGTLSANNVSVTIDGEYRYVSLYPSGVTYPKSVTFFWERSYADQTLTVSADSAYIDQTIAVSSDAISPVTWSVVDDEDTTASEAAVNSSGVVSVSGAGTVKVKAVAQGYNPAIKILTFSNRPAAPYISVEDEPLEGYTGLNDTIDFTYGNLNSTLAVSSNNLLIASVQDLSASAGNASVRINYVGAGSTTIDFKDGESVLDSITVNVIASSVSITGLANSKSVGIGRTLDLGSSITVTPVGSLSSDVTWESNNESIATVDSNGVVTGVAYGVATITVTSDDYPSATMACNVSVMYPSSNLSNASSIAIGDIVYLVCDDASAQFDGISSTSTKYAFGLEYVGTPDPDAGVAFEVCEGNSEETFAFKLLSGDSVNKYLYWGSGNSLNVNASINDGSSWNVSFEGGNAVIKNASDATRVIWWNSTSPRFACYQNKEDDDDYKDVQLLKATNPNNILESASSVATIQGTENGGNVTNVVVRFGATVAKADWDSINADWPITDYGVMLVRKSTLQTNGRSSVKEAYNEDDELTIARKGTGTAPNNKNGVYAFSAKISYPNEDDYDTVFCAAPFIVAGGRYYFFEEMEYSVNTLAAYYRTNGGSSLSNAALDYLTTAGN